jgi:hypothetical protein
MFWQLARSVWRIFDQLGEPAFQIIEDVVASVSPSTILGTPDKICGQPKRTY